MCGGRDRPIDVVAGKRDHQLEQAACGPWLHRLDKPNSEETGRGEKTSDEDQEAIHATGVMCGECMHA